MLATPKWVLTMLPFGLLVVANSAMAMLEDASAPNYATPTSADSIRAQAMQKYASYLPVGTKFITEATTIGSVEQKKLLDAAAALGKVVYPTRSSNGDSDIFVSNVDGTWTSSLASGIGDQVQVFSDPTSQRFIYRNSNQNGTSAGNMIVKTDGTMRYPVGSGTAEAESMDPLGIVLNRLVYAAYDQTNLSTFLASVRLDGSERRLLENGNVSEKILIGDLVVYQKAEFPGQLFSVNLDGTSRKKLTDSVNGQFIVGSVGKSVLFAELKNGQFDIYAVAADGSGAPIPLATSSNDEVVAAVYNGRIYYYVGTATGVSINSMRPDGSDRKQIVGGAGNRGIYGFANGKMITWKEVTTRLRGTTIFGMNLDGSSVAQLSSGDGVSLSCIINDRVIYTNATYPESANIVNLYGVSTAGTGKVKLAHGLDTYFDGENRMASEADIVYCLPNSKRVFVRKFHSGDGPSMGNFSYTGVSATPIVISRDPDEWLAGGNGQRLVLVRKSTDGTSFSSEVRSVLLDGSSTKVLNRNIFMTSEWWESVFEYLDDRRGRFRFF